MRPGDIRLDRVGQGTSTIVPDVTRDWQFIHRSHTRQRYAVLAERSPCLLSCRGIGYVVYRGPCDRGRTCRHHYGFTSIRFISPCFAGSPLSWSFTTQAFVERQPSSMAVDARRARRLENVSRPALIAEADNLDDVLRAGSDAKPGRAVLAESRHGCSQQQMENAMLNLLMIAIAAVPRTWPPVTS